MENELTKALDKKFMNAAKFSLEVEKLVLEEKVNYIDAIVLFCEKNSIEVDSVTKLISKPLKEKLKADAINLNFMKKFPKKVKKKFPILVIILSSYEYAFFSYLEPKIKS